MFAHPMHFVDLLGIDMQLPDIAVSYEQSIPVDIFEEFKKSVYEEGLNITVEPRANAGVYAGLEWYLPTVIMVFIGKSYFDGFLKEAGKDHCQKLKESLSSLTNKTMSKPRIEPIIFGSKEGKLRKDNPYSLAFSIYSEANDGNKFKLLLPKPHDNSDYTEIIHKFLDFLNNYHGGIKVLTDIGFDEDAKPPGKLILVHMNLESKKIE
ncbi:MAG: hypothetical protein ACXV8Q_15570 [Methylobacter sp.]